MQGDPFGLLLQQRIVFMGGEVRPRSQAVTFGSTGRRVLVLSHESWPDLHDASNVWNCSFENLHHQLGDTTGGLLYFKRAVLGAHSGQQHA